MRPMGHTVLWDTREHGPAFRWSGPASSQGCPRISHSPCNLQRQLRRYPSWIARLLCKSNHDAQNSTSDFNNIKVRGYMLVGAPIKSKSQRKSQVTEVVLGSANGSMLALALYFEV